MKVVLSQAAITILTEIGDFIARDSPHHAGKFFRLLRLKSRQIARAPKTFPLAPMFEHLNIRRRIVGNYVIFYRIDDHAVTIIDILNAARDVETWFSADR